MLTAHENFLKVRYDTSQGALDMPQEEFVSMKMSEMVREIDRISGRQKFEQDRATFDYPRKGPNNKVKEVDLRIWETLFSESLKVLNKWE
jgi:hypothetical protein